MKECNASLHLYFVIPVAGEINTKLMYVIKFVIYYECATLNCKQGVLRPYLCQVPRRVLPLRHRPRRLRPHERGAAQGGRASALEQVGARRGQSLSRDDKRQSRYGPIGPYVMMPVPNLAQIQLVLPQIEPSFFLLSVLVQLSCVCVQGVTISTISRCPSVIILSSTTKKGQKLMNTQEPRNHGVS